MAIGDITKIIPAQAVKIFRGAEELILTDDVTFRGTHVRNVTNTRAGPIYTFQWRTREIDTKIALTEDLQTQMESDNQLNSRSALAQQSWRIQGLNIGGATGDDTDDTYTAMLQDYENLAPETGVAEARIKLLIVGTAT